MNANPSNPYDYIIIGDGFCSLMAAAHILKRARNHLCLGIIGRAADWGPGIAYGRCDYHHLLNVPAARMGAWADAPEDFLRWVLAHKKKHEWQQFAKDEETLAHVFLPRLWYGDYLRVIAAQVRMSALENGHSLDFHRGNAENAVFGHGLFTVSTADKKIQGRSVILANGVPETVITPDDPVSFMIDPWDTDFENFRDATQPVMILGTGLTMIDIVVSLQRRNFKGKIAAISRRGLLPQPHAAPVFSDVRNVQIQDIKGTLAHKMRAFRANIRACLDAGIPWPVYFDHIRKDTPAIWKSLSSAEQKKFIVRLLPLWNVHRHRQPPSTFAMLQTLIAQGQLSFHKGRVRWQDGETLSAKFSDGQSYENVLAVFNARGPDYSYARNPLLKNLTARGYLRPHPSGIGLDINDNLAAQGGAPNLYVLGSLTSGHFLESTSAPELRAQCAQLAKFLHS